MSGYTILLVLVSIVGHTRSQFYNPTLFLRGFDIPFRGFIRNFEKQSGCQDPCKSTTCSTGTTCRIVQVQCFRAPCPSVPTCMDDRIDDVNDNPCFISNPLMSTSGKEIDACVVGRSDKCPTGSKCTSVLYGQGTRCCHAPSGCQHARKATAFNRGRLSSLPDSNNFGGFQAIFHGVLDKAPQQTLRHKAIPKVTFQEQRVPEIALRRNNNPNHFHDPIHGVFREEPRGVKPQRPKQTLVRQVVTKEDSQSENFPEVSQRTGSLSTFPPRVNPGRCLSALSYRTCRTQCRTDSDCGQGKCCPTRCGTAICTFDESGRYVG